MLLGEAVREADQATLAKVSQKLEPRNNCRRGDQIPHAKDMIRLVVAQYRNFSNYESMIRNEGTDLASENLFLRKIIAISIIALCIDSNRHNAAASSICLQETMSEDTNVSVQVDTTIHVGHAIVPCRIETSYCDTILNVPMIISNAILLKQLSANMEINVCGGDQPWLDASRDQSLASNAVLAIQNNDLLIDSKKIDDVGCENSIDVHLGRIILRRIRLQGSDALLGLIPHDSSWQHCISLDLFQGILAVLASATLHMCCFDFVIENLPRSIFTTHIA